MDARRLLTALLLALLPGIATLAQGTFAIDVEPGPYAIEQALQQARLRRLHHEGDTAVLRLKAGTYRLLQPVVVRPEDTHTTLMAEGNVVLSGAVQVKGWRRHGKVWVADVPEFNGRPIEFRQLWVNGRKAVRARDVSDFEQMARILSVDKPLETLYVPARAVRPILHERRAELVLHEMWCVANLRIKDIQVKGDSAAITFHQPESHVHFMHPWPSPMVTPGGEHNSPFYLTNSRTLLDAPGEWHLDTDSHRLYYYPRDGEDMATADVEAPALETLLQVAGTPDRPVADVRFEGIRFEHTTWLRPSLKGHAPLQAGMYLTEAYKIRPQIRRPNGDHGLDNQGWVGRPEAAVSINCARGVHFACCTLRHLGATGIDFHRYVADCSITHSELTDIGGTAILAGSFGPEAHEAHLPYDPSDRRETCRGLLIADNRIADAANDDWGCVGIGAGYVRGIRIEHNEIAHVSYTGISLGWGWNQQPCTMADNRVAHNHIHHYARHMYDTAGIYTLGSQPHTFVEANVVDSICKPSYVHDPEHWFYLYTDEGSSGITVRNNWTPSEKYLQNSNGPGNPWENNGPQVADSIRSLAGPRPQNNSTF